MTQEEKRAAYYKAPQRLHVYEPSDKAKEKLVSDAAPGRPIRRLP